MSDEVYDGIIRTAVTAAAATGPLAISPVPSADAVVVAGIWTTMMIAIAKRSGHSIDAKTGKKVVLAFIHQAGAYWVGSKALTWIVAKVPGIGMVTGSGANSILNATFTVWLGVTFIDLSEREDFELIDWAVYIESLKDAKRPYANVGKLRRVRDFFKRWLRIEGTTKPLGGGNLGGVTVPMPRT